MSPISVDSYGMASKKEDKRDITDFLLHPFIFIISILGFLLGVLIFSLVVGNLD